MGRKTVISGELSVVIPVLNEAAGLGECLRSLAPLRERGAEVIVCDGQSSDATVEIARSSGVEVLSSARGRARQMNAGAAAARGRMLAFLHADSRLDSAALERLWTLARDSGPQWGRFDVRLSGSGWSLRVIEACMNLRSRLTGIATGDQCMFCSAELFLAVGGFADIDLMEDIDLSGKLRRISRPLCCRERVCTSSRKWREYGVVRTVWLMWRLRAAYACGADPARLARLYYRPVAQAADGDSPHS